MKKRITVLGILLFALVLTGAFHEVFAGSVEITLKKNAVGSSQIDFGSAHTYAWGGDILYNGDKIGVFNAIYTATGTNDYLIQYDLVIPVEGQHSDFASIRVSRMNGLVVGAVSLRGTVFAASPGLKGIIGATVDMIEPVVLNPTGLKTTITY